MEVQVNHFVVQVGETNILHTHSNSSTVQGWTAAAVELLCEAGCAFLFDRVEIKSKG
jgi:hypothetical protein